MVCLPYLKVSFVQTAADHCKTNDLAIQSVPKRNLQHYFELEFAQARSVEGKAPSVRAAELLFAVVIAWSKLSLLAKNATIQSSIDSAEPTLERMASVTKRNRH